MPCGTTTQWQPSILASAPLASAANTPCGPPSKLSSSPAIIALSASWSSLNCETCSLRPCLAAKSRVDTISKIPASALALISPWCQIFSCAAAEPASAPTPKAAIMTPSALGTFFIVRFLPVFYGLCLLFPQLYHHFYVRVRSQAHFAGLAFGPQASPRTHAQVPRQGATRHDPKIQPQRRRQGPYGRCRSRHAAALRVAQRCG